MKTRHVLALISMTLAPISVTANLLAADATTTVGKVVQDAKTKVFELLDKKHVTVNFKNSSATLEQSEIDELKTLLEANKGQGAIERVIVATWADKEYPAGKGEKLSEADRKLADQRAEGIKKALTSLGITKVDTYSMAEHPSWISKAFNSEQAKVKGEGAVKSADDQLASEIGQKMRDKGGPGTAVVLVRHAGDYSAH